MTLLEPAYRSDFVLVKGEQRNLWSVFSSLENRFFYRLTQGLSKILEKSSFESSFVLEVTNGMKRLKPDFVPSSAKTNDTHWDKTDAAMHWKSQHPVGYQSVMKFAPKPDKTPAEEGEAVLYVTESVDDAFMKTYDIAVVVDIDEENPNLYYLRGEDEDALVVEIHRDNIRKLSDVDEVRSEREYKAGDMVLFDDVDGEHGGLFHNGVITARTGEHEYSLYLLTFHKTVLHHVSAERLLMMAESPEFTQTLAPLERQVLVDAFEAALLESMELNNDKTALSRESVSIGKGAIEIALWPDGHAVMKWDGANTVEVNLFLQEEDVVARNVFVDEFKASIPSLITTMLDEFPRGYGKVVNLQKEMETDPLWLHKYDGSVTSES
ncbi:MAG: hypothetical protein SGARI_002586 [Bacillariaceae sp.]